MLRWPAVLLLALLAPLEPLKPAPDGPAYTADDRLKYPADYPEWVFLGAGLDMSYTQSATPDHSMFNTVFANPSAYRSFKQTGTWPEGTMLVLENRGAAGDVSISKRGKTQTSELMGLEIHVKDTAHFKDGWAFYGFDDKVSAKMIDKPASCYTCHEQHAAVDTTFVQYYPNLLEVAKAKKTFSKEYLKDVAALPNPDK